MMDFYVGDDDVVIVFVVSHEPFIPLEFHLWGFLGLHVCRFADWRGGGGFTPGGGLVRDEGGDAKFGVFVRHLGFVNLLKAGGDGRALVDFGEDGISARYGGGTAVELGWGWGGRRGRGRRGRGGRRRRRRGSSSDGGSSR